MRPRIPVLTAVSALLLAGLSAPPAAATPGQEVTYTLPEALAALTVDTEARHGYDRDYFRHWIDGDRNGCNTRQEVLLVEATKAPARGTKCTLTGGSWTSYYDGQVVDNSKSLDVDHMVPLAESWDSGAWAWDAATRRDYANDLGDSRSLVAVTARSNRSKADQDPAQWMPPASGAWCRYIAEWLAVKTRWGLSIDQDEEQVLAFHVGTCAPATITVTKAR